MDHPVSTTLYTATMTWLTGTLPEKNLLTEIKAQKNIDLLLTLNKVTNSPPEDLAAVLDQILGASAEGARA